MFRAGLFGDLGVVWPSNLNHIAKQNDGTWMAWENYSAAVVATAAVAHPLGRPRGKKRREMSKNMKYYRKGVEWNLPSGARWRSHLPWDLPKMSDAQTKKITAILTR